MERRSPRACRAPSIRVLLVHSAVRAVAVGGIVAGMVLQQDSETAIAGIGAIVAIAGKEWNKWTNGS